MRLHVHPKAKTVQITEDTKQYLEKRLEKVSKLFRREPEAQFTQNFERGQYIVEVTLSGEGVLLRSQERNPDLRVAIDKVVDKLDAQWKRFKQKRVDNRQHQSSAIRGESALVSEDEPEYTPRIVRRKNFTLESMAPEDAARQMELLGHTFFVFTDETTNRVGVLYKREGGDYGLIEPDA